MERTLKEEVSASDKSAILKVLEDHAQQLSRLISTKADMAALVTLTTAVSDKEIKEDAVILMKTTQYTYYAQEMQELKEILSNKPNKEEVQKLKEMFNQSVLQNAASHFHGMKEASPLQTSIARVHFRCIACGIF